MINMHEKIHQNEKGKVKPLIFISVINELDGLAQGTKTDQYELKGTTTLKASALQMQVLTKSCNMPQTLSKSIEKYENYRCLYRRQLKAMDSNHFRLSDVTNPSLNIHKQNN